MRNLIIKTAWFSYQFIIFTLFHLVVNPDLLRPDITDNKVQIVIGKSRILDFTEPIKRVSVTDPDIADVTVASPKQILINGKSIGSTSLIIWDESEKYTFFDLSVHNALASQQIMLQVRFAEVNRNALKEVGVNLLALGSDLKAGGFAGKVNTPSIPLSLNENVDIFLSHPSSGLSAIIRALEEKRLLTTLAEPNLVTVSGNEASFLAGGEFPIPVVQGIVGGVQTVTIVFKEFGIKLNFIPTVMDSVVNLRVSPEVSSLDFENGVSLSGFKIPALLTRKAETTVELKDGESLVIGGLISNEMAKASSKVPILGDIPVLSTLFRSSRFLHNETELIILISPKIIRPLSQERIPELPE